jgi:hypothetical protein
MASSLGMMRAAFANPLAPRFGERYHGIFFS